MKKIVILVSIACFGWYINLPSDMPQTTLARYNNARLIDQQVSVGGPCEQEKCLVVYVAPWCPSCKSLTPMINDLVSDLQRDGIKATVVIGKDSMKNVLDYSKRYKVPILADASGGFFSEMGAKGVPYFAVSNKHGKRVSEMSGGYYDVNQMRAQLDL